MEIKLNIDRKNSYVLKIEHIESIWVLFEKYIGIVNITIISKDNITRKFDSLSDFSDYKNSPSKQIENLIIVSELKDCEKAAYIEFSNGQWSNTITVNIDSDSESSIIELRSEINDVLAGSKPWYARLAKIDFFYVVFFITTFSIFYLNSSQTQNNEGLAIGQAITNTAIISLALAVLAVIVWALNKLRQRYFPVAFFAIGQGLDRFKIDEKVRWVIVVGFIVSLSASLVSIIFK